MKRRICRQVLDCGVGVCEVTALALAALKIPKRPADTAFPIQSGDSEDSVAAVQDARAPTRAATQGVPKEFQALRYADALRLVLRTQPRSGKMVGFIFSMPVISQQCAQFGVRCYG